MGVNLQNSDQRLHTESLAARDATLYMNERWILHRHSERLQCKPT